jgi:hypothetical protein
MILVLSLAYTLMAFAYFYSYKAGYSLLRYMFKRKNINVYLSVEIVFLIITSYIVFTNQPLNWIIAILMLLHASGIIWLISNPAGFYEILEESFAMDENISEISVVAMLLMSAMLVLFSRVFF